MPHPLLETSVMTNMVRKFGTRNLWFLDNIFKPRQVNTWQAEYYVMDYSRRMAPMQGRGRAGTMRPKAERVLIKQAFLHTRPKDTVKDVDMLSLRRPGSSDTSEAWGKQLVVETLNDLRRQVDMTMEWVGAQMLQAATLTATIDGASISINTGLATTQVATAAAGWATVGTDIMSDIFAQQNVIRRDSGINPEFMLMASSVNTALTNNTTIQNYLKETRDVDNIMREGRIARLFGMDVYNYDEYYKPDDGTFTRIWNADLVLFGSFPAKSQTEMLIGPPEDIDMQGVGGGIASKTEKSWDPGGINVLVDANFYPAIPIPEAFVVFDITP